MKRLGRKSVFGTPRSIVFLKNNRNTPGISCVFLKNSRNTPGILCVFLKNGRSNPLDGLNN